MIIEMLETSGSGDSIGASQTERQAFSCHWSFVCLPYRLHTGRSFGSVRRQFSYHIAKHSIVICFDSNHGLRCQSLHVAFSVHGDGINPMIGDDVYRPFLVTLVVECFQVGSPIISVSCIVMHCFWQV